MSPELLQFIVTGITQGAVYALVATGFNLVYSATGIINFAQGEFVMLGGLLLVTCLATFHLPLVVAVLLVVPAVMLLGAGVHELTIRPLRSAPPVTLIMVTVGVSVALRGLARVAWGPDSFSVAHFSGTAPLSFAGATVDTQNLWVMGVTGLAAAALALFLRRTLTGRAMVACALNPRAAELVGIRVTRMNMWAFALAGGLGALGGVVLAPLALPSYDVGLMLALKGFCAAILGGIGNNAGALLGGLILGLLESLGAGYWSSGYRDAIAFMLLLLILLLRPSGLLGGGGRRDRV